MAAPMPAAPPVIIATRPSSRPGISDHLVELGIVDVEQVGRWHVFLDRHEAARMAAEAVVGLRNRDRGDLSADEHVAAFLRPEAVVEARYDRQASAVRDLEHLAGSEG